MGRERLRFAFDLGGQRVVDAARRSVLVGFHPGLPAQLFVRAVQQTRRQPGVARLQPRLVLIDDSSCGKRSGTRDSIVDEQLSRRAAMPVNWFPPPCVLMHSIGPGRALQLPEAASSSSRGRA